MFDNVCSIPLSHDLFAQAVHPEEPIVSVGLASGHVYTYRLPAGASDDDDGDVSLASERGFGCVDTAWKTRRHKGSCRTLAFGYDGAQLYSAGTDGLLKAAHVATGQVSAKIAVPVDPATGDYDHPTLIHALSPQSLLLATDSSALHLYDLRAVGPQSVSTPQQTFHPHDDYISSLTPLPPTAESTSGFSKQWVSTGGSTLAVTDLRRGVMVRSEDQEEELLSSVMVSGLSSRGTSVGEKVLVGGGSGVVTLWERGVWDDQDERITVDRAPGGGASLDCIALVPDGVGPGGKIAVVGQDNGVLRFIRIQPNKVLTELKHDELQAEGVVGLDFDVTGRMISGGGKMIKIWHEKMGYEQDSDSDDSDDEEEEGEETNGNKRPHGGSSDNSGADSDDSSEEEKLSKKKKKKRRRGKAPQQDHGHGILGFTGMD